MKQPSIMHCHAFYCRLIGDVRPYLLVQTVSCVVIPLVAILLLPTYTHSTYWLWDAGLKPLSCDVDVLKLTEDPSGFDLVDLYVEHEVDNPDIIDEAEEFQGVDVVDDLKVNNDKNDNVVVDDDGEVNNDKENNVVVNDDVEWWPARSKLRVGPWDLCEGTYLMGLRQEGIA
ncbi:uroporphyrin-III C-methyltransferase [Lathyrus oleraceus]|uniref:Uroporphyrin-III C-methyltransferase n=1 Tax=Pisum sativum TaxID=3888 RepID=A0A9D4ZTF0_PEA|nr:uroporphyrin-III C-methyltransferase [Pisum sativum]